LQAVLFLKSGLVNSVWTSTTGVMGGFYLPDYLPGVNTKSAPYEVILNPF